MRQPVVAPPTSGASLRLGKRDGSRQIPPPIVVVAVQPVVVVTVAVATTIVRGRRGIPRVGPMQGGRGHGRMIGVIRLTWSCVVRLVGVVTLGEPIPSRRLVSAHFPTPVIGGIVVRVDSIKGRCN